MNLAIPPGAALVLRAQFHDGLCRFWRLRNAPDRNTRRLARRSVHAFCALLRQLR